MNNLIQITFEVTPEQFEALDSIGIFEGAGTLFKHCKIMSVVASGDGRPIKEKIREELHAKLKEHESNNRGVGA